MDLKHQQEFSEGVPTALRLPIALVALALIVGLPIYESFGEIAVITRALTGLGGGASRAESAPPEPGGKSVEA